MFKDNIEPEITYDFSEESTDVNQGNKTVTVVFDVTDKYFDSTYMAQFYVDASL